MRVTHEGDVDPVKLSTGGTGGTDPPVTDCCDVEPGDQPDLAENPDGLGDSSAHALEDVPGTPADQNLAHGTVTDGGGSPTWNDISHPPAHANDNNVATFARCNSGVLSAGSAYLKTDLGAAYAIGSIVVYGKDNGGVLPAGLTVDWSTDGSSWTATGLTPVVTSGPSSTLIETYTPGSPITARYWRLVWTHGGGFNNGKDVNTWELNGPSVLGEAWSLSVPEVIDGDDATYDEIDGPEVVRIDLGSPMRTGSSRLVIGTEFAGIKTYSIDAWNELDESDRVTLATFSFTGTGSFTAQDVLASWVTDTDYQFFELDGDDEDRYVYTWSLFAPTLATNHEHQASAVDYDNTASGLTADDVQEAIDELTARPIEELPTAETDDTLVLAPDGVGGVEWVTPTGGALTDHTHAATGSGSNGGGATLQPGTLDIPATSSPAQTAEGRAVWDSDDDKLTIGTGAARKTLVNEGAITGSGLTQATARLLGRTTASTGAVEEISVGTGLSLSAGSLSATGGGGSLTVEGDTGSPTDSAVTKLVFPSDALSITSHVATIRQVPTGFIGCSVSGTSTTLSNGAYVGLAFGAADTYDSDGFHDPSSNNTRMTVPAGLGGKYLLQALVAFPSSDTDRRIAYRINGGTDVILARPYYNDPGASWYVPGSVMVDLAAGDYIEVRAYSSTSSATTLYNAQLTRLSPGGSAGPAVGAKAYNSNTQSVAQGGPVALTLDSEDFDSDGFHSTSSNTSRMTIPAGLGGKYLVIGATTWDTSGAGNARLVGIFKNGATVGGHLTSATNTAIGPRQTCSVVLDLAAGDYVEVIVYQDSGANRTVGSASYDTSSQLTIMRLDSGSGTAPGTQLDYAEQTTPLNPIVPSAEASATAFLTGAGFTADGASSYMVEAFIPIAYVAAGHAINLWLFDGGSSIGQIGQLYSSGSATVGSALHLMRRVTPGAGTKTYSIRATSDASTGSSLFCGAGGAGNILPAYIRVTKS